MQQWTSLHISGLHYNNKRFCPKIGKNSNPWDSQYCQSWKYWSTDLPIYLWCHHLHQVDSLKLQLLKFYGEEPLKSDDLSRVVNSNHFNRLIKLLDDDKVSGKIVHGGQRDIVNLWVWLHFCTLYLLWFTWIRLWTFSLSLQQDCSSYIARCPGRFSNHEWRNIWSFTCYCDGKLS